jgi:hypothetical protein
MKTILISSISILIHLTAWGALPEPDTIIIQLENGQEVQIIAEGGNEAELLSDYDLNQIIQDLQTSMDSAALDGGARDEVSSVAIADSTGTRYRTDTANKDTVITVKIDLGNIRKTIRRIVVTNDKEDPADGSNTAYTKTSRKDKRTDNMLSFDLGFNNYLRNGKFPDGGNELYAVKPVVSWYVALGLLNRTRITGPLYLDWGANVSWYNFKFENERTRLTKGPEEVAFFESAEDIDPIKSKLVVPYLNVSLVPLFYFGNPGNSDWFVLDRDKGAGFRVGAGVYAGYRLGSRAKYVYREEGDRERVKDRTNFYVNNYRYGVRFQLGYRGVDVFANYDLNELFIQDRGPELNAFSFGIVF